MFTALSLAPSTVGWLIKIPWMNKWIKKCQLVVAVDPHDNCLPEETNDLSLKVAVRIAKPTLQRLGAVQSHAQTYLASKWQSQDRNPPHFLLQTLFPQPLDYSRAENSLDWSYIHTTPAWLLITCLKQQSRSTFQFYIAWNTTNGKSYNEWKIWLIYSIAHLSPAVSSCGPFKDLCWSQKTRLF